jgi:RNA polymerase sigma-70 factor (ECF subfamily)
VRHGTIPGVETSVLQRARTGDEQAFRELTEPYLRELQVHCYRMLGFLTEAEDVLQETLLAAWRGLPTFRQCASLRTWLYRIATNRCLNVRRASARRVPVEPIPPFTPPEPSRRDEIRWLQPYPDTLLDGIIDPTPGPEACYEAVESVELAVIAALQRMPPRQVAVLLLRDVLGFSTAETAEMLATTPTAAKGALQRARSAFNEQHPRSVGVSRPAPAVECEITRRFADAYTAGDIDTVLALLTDDAWLSMPPAPHQYHGKDAIAAFLQTSFAWRGGRRVRFLPARANGQPAFGGYSADPDATIAHASGLYVFTLAGDRIQAITRFHLPALYPRFGLPDTLAEPARPLP